MSELSPAIGYRHASPATPVLLEQAIYPSLNQGDRGVGSLVVYTLDFHADDGGSIPGCGL